MVEKYTKSELIRLRKELVALKNSARLLEERKRELYRLFRQMLKELETRAKPYNEQLGKVRDSLFELARRHGYLDMADDTMIQPQGLCELSEEIYMKGVITDGVKMTYPDLKGQFVSEMLKKSFLDELRPLVEQGMALDRLVKKTVIVREEMKSVSRKLGYIQNILIPRVGENIKKIEGMFDERRREELIKVKKFKEKSRK